MKPKFSLYKGAFDLPYSGIHGKNTESDDLKLVCLAF